MGKNQVDEAIFLAVKDASKGGGYHAKTAREFFTSDWFDSLCAYCDIGQDTRALLVSLAGQ